MTPSQALDLALAKVDSASIRDWVGRNRPAFEEYAALPMLAKWPASEVPTRLHLLIISEAIGL